MGSYTQLLWWWSYIDKFYFFRFVGFWIFGVNEQYRVFRLAISDNGV